MYRRIFHISLLSLSIAACSSLETRQQAKGNFDYTAEPTPSELKVPENLHAPVAKNDYLIPNDADKSGPIGGDVDIRAPALVLPLAAGSRIDDYDKSAAVWFDKVDDDRDLNELVIKAITDFLKSQDVGFSSTDVENYVWESDWLHKEIESGIWFWESVDLTESWRYRFSLITKTHGRSVGLNVELIEYMKTSDKGATKTIDPIEKQRVEMTMLNSITSQLDYQYRLNNRDDRIARANMKIVTLGQSTDTNPALIIDYPIAELWDYLPGFFNKYNFTVTDINEDKFIYFVDYTRIDASLWEKMWGDDVPVIEFADGPYEFHLQSIGKQTSVVIYNDDKEVISEKILTENFEILEPALSFRN